MLVKSEQRIENLEACMSVQAIEESYCKITFSVMHSCLCRVKLLIHFSDLLVNHNIGLKVLIFFTEGSYCHFRFVTKHFSDQQLAIE